MVIMDFVYAKVMKKNGAIAGGCPLIVIRH